MAETPPPASLTYSGNVKQIWTGRMAQAAGKYAEQAPMAAVCCNACRTCVTTNIFGIATAAAAGTGLAVMTFLRRHKRLEFESEASSAPNPDAVARRCDCTGKGQRRPKRHGAQGQRQNDEEHQRGEYHPEDRPGQIRHLARVVRVSMQPENGEHRSKRQRDEHCSEQRGAPRSLARDGDDQPRQESFQQ